MLIDLFANPGDLDPAAFAARVKAAGLGGAVVARTHAAGDMTPWLSALEDLDLAAFAGVGIELERGRVVFLPEDWQGPFADADWTPPEGEFWTWEDLQARVEDLGGAIVAGHPFDQAGGRALGDRVLSFEGLAGITTRSGAERAAWDRLADGAAVQLAVSAVGSSGGIPGRLGAAATAVSDDIMDEPELVAALRDGLAFAVEFEATDARKDRDPRRPRSREDEDRGRPRGRRDDDRDGRRGSRDDRGGRRDRR